jgi:hypothetical protein
MDDRENIPQNTSLDNKHSYDIAISAGTLKGAKEEIKLTLPNSSIEKRTAHRSSASSSGL